METTNQNNTILLKPFSQIQTYPYKKLKKNPFNGGEGAQLGSRKKIFWKWPETSRNAIRNYF